MRISVVCVLLSVVAVGWGQEVADLGVVNRRIVEGTNAFRGEQKLKALNVNATLEKVAGGFAKYMAETGKYGHEADGRTPARRAEAGGYRYCVVLENIAMQYDSEGFTNEALSGGFVTGWKNSPGHRKNMLDSDVTEIGVGVARAADGKYYAVQVFGRPESAKVTFSVVNGTKGVVKYRLGDREYDVPVRGTRTHEECRVGKLVIGGKEWVPEDGQRFAVGEGGKVTVSGKGK